MVQEKKFPSAPTVLGMVFLMIALFAIASVASIPTTHAATTDNQGHVRWVPDNFSELAEKYSPAVVNIRSEKNGKRRLEVDPHFKGNPNDPFNDFLRNFSGVVPSRDSNRGASDPVSSSTMTVTSSPTTTWWKGPTRSR